MKSSGKVLYPKAVDIKRVGKYSTLAHSGGGYFYDDVLEYRVWIHPEGKEVYYRAFSTFEEALQFSESTTNAEKPVVLVSQEEYIDEATSGQFAHVKKPRIAEWQPDWLKNSKGTKKNIPKFLEQNK
jgi:hypothetical protein